MGGKCNICEKDGADRVYYDVTVHSTCILNAYKLKLDFFKFKKDRYWRRQNIKGWIFHPIFKFKVRREVPEVEDDSW
jgi:hypothetical protein